MFEFKEALRCLEEVRGYLAAAGSSRRKTAGSAIADSPRGVLSIYRIEVGSQLLDTQEALHELLPNLELARLLLII